MIRADGLVKVLDFGLALRTDDQDTVDLTTRTHTTAPGSFTGTPSYMAPEFVKGEPAGTPGDVFALGVVLYEMASGRRPFSGLSSASIIASIVSDEPVSLGRLNPDDPGGLRRARDADAAQGAGAAPDGEGGRAAAWPRFAPAISSRRRRLPSLRRRPSDASRSGSS